MDKEGATDMQKELHWLFCFHVHRARVRPGWSRSHWSSSVAVQAALWGASCLGAVLCHGVCSSTQGVGGSCRVFFVFSSCWRFINGQRWFKKFMGDRISSRVSWVSPLVAPSRSSALAFRSAWSQSRGVRVWPRALSLFVSSFSPYPLGFLSTSPFLSNKSF